MPGLTTPRPFAPALALVLTGLLLAGGARADDAADAAKGSDLEKLKGQWTAKVGPDKNVDADIAFDGKAVTIKVTTPDGMEFTLKGEVKLDDAAKPFKTIDWTKFTTPNGDDAPENKGIYKFEDDGKTLKVCNGGPGNPRPSEFKDAEGGPQILELKRTPETPKPADKPKG